MDDKSWVEGCMKVLSEVLMERSRQVARYGLNEDIFDGTGPEVRWLPYTSSSAKQIEIDLRQDYENFSEETGNPTWVHLLREELAEAFCEDDPQRLEAELLQVAALAVSWIERLRARGAHPLVPDD